MFFDLDEEDPEASLVGVLEEVTKAVDFLSLPPLGSPEWAYLAANPDAAINAEFGTAPKGEDIHQTRIA